MRVPARIWCLGSALSLAAMAAFAIAGYWGELERIFALGMASAFLMGGLVLIIANACSNHGSWERRSTEARLNLGNCSPADHEDLKAKLEQALDLALVAKGQAEQANLAKSKFLAAASHDLRQPVQSLMLYMAILEQRVTDTPLATLASQMDFAVEALNGLLTSLLDVSRLDAGVIVPTLTVEPVHAMIGRLAQEYEFQAKARGLRLVSRVEPAQCLTDSSLLERIVRNLLENALRYTRDGGILVRLRVCHDRVRLDVMDTGIGIAPEHRAAVFDEFFQAGNRARDRAEGLGLGLAIVARLCKLIDAEVMVASRLGRGSRFTITLPLPKPHIEAQTVAGSTTRAERPSAQPLVGSGDGCHLHFLQVELAT